ncbi:MAG: ATP-binding protein [Candidatus Lutacidiplasmatales archaeon]
MAAASASGDPPFIGRLEALDSLRRRSDAVRDGRGGFTLIEGDAGVGKSTLLNEVLAESAARGATIRYGRALATEEPPPFQLIRSALESPRYRTGSQGTETSDRVLIGFAPRVKDRSEPPVGPVEQQLLDAVSSTVETAGANRDRLFTAVSDHFLKLSEQAPTLLALDDIHLADDASLECIAYLAPQVENESLWIVATTLTLASLPEERRGALERLRENGRAEEITVRPMNASEVGDFVRASDPGREVGVEEVTRLHSQTAGNPSFLSLLMRTERQKGHAALRPPESGAPPGLTGYLERQLPELTENEQRVLTVAAVLGRECDFPLLLRASGEEEERLAEIGDRLVSRGILVERPDERLEFARDELRRQIYERLTDTRRRLLHRRVAEAIEASGEADASTVYALARHFYLGKVDAKASSYNRLAAEFAAAAFAPNVARLHLERALECHARAAAGDLVGELEMTLELAVQLDRLGEIQPAESLLRTALAPRPPGQEISPAQRLLLRVYWARILTDMGRWGEADRITRELLQEVDATTSPRAVIALHRLRGEILYYQGRYEESLHHHDDALAHARSTHDDREVALEMVRRANVLGMIPDRLEEAIGSYEGAIESLKAQGDLGEAAFALLFLGVVLAQYGRIDEGLLELNEAMQLAERAHDLRRVGWSLFNMADLEREKGLIEPALEHNRRSREILGRIGDRFGLVQTIIIDGKLRLARGDTKAAELELLEAYRMIRELNAPADELDVLLRLAEVSLAKGDAPGARARLKELDAREVGRVRPDLSRDLARLRESLDREAPRDGA